MATAAAAAAVVVAVAVEWAPVAVDSAVGVAVADSVESPGSEYYVFSADSPAFEESSASPAGSPYLYCSAVIRERTKNTNTNYKCIQTDALG